MMREVFYANRLSDRSCARGMIHNKIYLVRRSYPRPSMALQCRIMALKKTQNTIHSFIHPSIHASIHSLIDCGVLQEKAEEQRRQQQHEAAWRLQQEQHLANIQLPQSANWAKNQQQQPTHQPSLTLAQIQAAEAKEQEEMREVWMIAQFSDLTIRKKIKKPNCPSVVVRLGFIFRAESCL